LPSQTGIQVIKHTTEDLLAPSGAESRTIKFPKDFHVNWIEITASFQGVTDEPTEAEKLAKLGTYNIKTQSGKGSHITNQDFDDLFYWNHKRHFHGQSPFLAGDGGGDNDFHTLSLVIDAGCGRRINSTCGWAKDLNAKLEINFAADSGLDNTRVRVTFWGYNGSRPKRVAKVKFLSETGTSGEEGSEIKFNDGDLLQEVFAFNTTEANLATIQTLDGYTVKEIRVYDNGKDLSDRFYASELLTQLTDTVAGLHEYSGISYDPMPIVTGKRLYCS